MLFALIVVLGFILMLASQFSETRMPAWPAWASWTLASLVWAMPLIR